MKIVNTLMAAAVAFAAVAWGPTLSVSAAPRGGCPSGCCAKGNCCSKGKCCDKKNCCKPNKACCDPKAGVCKRSCGCKTMNCCAGGSTCCGNKPKGKKKVTQRQSLTHTAMVTKPGSYVVKASNPAHAKACCAPVAG